MAQKAELVDRNQYVICSPTGLFYITRTYQWMVTSHFIKFLPSPSWNIRLCCLVEAMATDDPIHSGSFTHPLHMYNHVPQRFIFHIDSCNIYAVFSFLSLGLPILWSFTYLIIIIKLYNLLTTIYQYLLIDKAVMMTWFNDLKIFSKDVNIFYDHWLNHDWRTAKILFTIYQFTWSHIPGIKKNHPMSAFCTMLKIHPE